MSWTSDTLFSYFSKVIEDNKERARVEYEHTVNMLHREHDKFEMDIANRFKATNELRGALDDLGRKMETKAEGDAAHKALSDKIDKLGELVTALTSRVDQSPDVRLIQNELAKSQGLNKGSELTMGRIYAAIGALGVILGIVVLLANGRL